MYRLVTAPSADRDIEKLKRVSEQDFQRLTRIIRSLAEEPRPHGVRKIKGRNETYRIRVGNYRVIYKIYDIEKLVMVSHLLRRNEGTYRA